MRVRFSDRLLDELAALERHLAQEVSPAFAEAYIAALVDRVEALAQFPLRFAPRPELGDGARALVFRSRYVVGYRVRDGEVLAFRLLGPGQETS